MPSLSGKEENAMKIYEREKVAESYILNLDKQYDDNAIVILGGAVFASSAIKSMDYDTFTEHLMKVPGNCVFWGWNNGIEDALNHFCHACMVDPKLIEVYLGITFAEIANIYS